MFKHILVPIDNSALSSVLIGDAVRFAAAQASPITFFHAVSDYLSTGEGALMRTLSPDEAARMADGDAHAVLNKAEASARAAGVPCSSVYAISDKVHLAIVDAVAQHGCDLIYTATRGPKGVGNIFVGSTTVQLLAHSPVPVLVSSVARMRAQPSADEAIGLIEDEHRSLAAVIHGMRDILDSTRNGERLPEFSLLKQMIFYIRKFPEELHHPKEESVLFARLQARTREVDDVLAELRGQHEDRSALDKLSEALAYWEANGDPGAARFAACLEEFASAEWKHMGLEEYVVLPAARHHLTVEDWNAVEQAFSGNQTPRAQDVTGEAFKRFFSRIMRDASPVGRDG